LITLAHVNLPSLSLPHLRRLLPALALLAALAAAPRLRAQELEPRAYSPSPVGFNIFAVAFTHNTGDLNFDPSLPITDASASINVGALAYVRTLGLAGRSANLGIALPYVRGDLEGIYLGDPIAAYRSGLGDPRVRLAVNLRGAPAMTPQEFMARKPGDTLIGASLVVSVPTGQYDPTKLVNIGNNRWGFKPEIGISKEFGRWTFEGCAGVWLLTDNTDFYGGKTRSQEPISSLQAHIIYTFKPRMWLAFDANFYNGGRTSVDGVPKADLQQNSRAGLTFSLPVTKTQSLKFSFSKGAVTSVGADFDSYGVAWQVIWR
jgi:hypothetical protein